MATDKYPRSGKDGSPTMDSEVRRTGNATDYKTDLATQFDVLGNWIPTRISGATPFAPKAEMYDELSSAVTAIERGQASKWAFSNLISGMNAPSIDVRDASIELLEVCRVELMKLDEINEDPTLSAQQKKDKIAKEKAFIFGLLGDIRNANAREGTFKWTNDFLSSMGKKFGQSLNRTNFALAILGVAVCVTVSVLATLGTLAFLGVFAPYALPFVIAGVCLFAFCKLVKGVYNAWQDANQLAAKSKTASGNKILDTAATYKEKNLSIPRQERDAAKVDMESTQKSINEELGKLDTVLNTLRLPIQKQISELTELETVLKKRISAQQEIIDSPAAKRTIKAANKEILKLQRDLQDNAGKQASLNTLLKAYDVTYPVSPNVPQLLADTALLPEIQQITDRLEPLADALPGKVQTHADKEKACLAAEQSAEQSRARANKTPDATTAATTAARKSLEEILGDKKELGDGKSSRTMGSGNM